VDVALLVGVVGAAQRSELVEAIDVVRVHAGTANELLA
jgi:hypothetical protein